MDLIRTAQIAEPDAFYNELIDAQRGLSDEEAALMNAKLVLLLANHIGSREVLRQALALARPAAQAGPATAPSAAAR